VKPLPLILIVALLCFLVAIILPQIIRVTRTGPLPVSVTALGTAEMIQASAFFPAGVRSGSLPVIDQPTHGNPEETILGYPGLTEFAARVLNGQADQLVGVFVPGVMSLPIRQQPVGQPDYVDREQNIVTQFSLPSKYGSTGLLAHNYLSGNYFFHLKASDNVVLVYGDGRLEHYRISTIKSFQALKPNSPFSEFVDLANPNGGVISSADLFNQVYTTSHQLVFQTCIDNYGEPSWGRMFVIASLAEPLRLNVPDINGMISSN
jgi:hypothetical protein